jgi:hypothetical protein
MLEDFREGFQRQHVEVKEIASLLVYSFLQSLLGRRVGGHIANSSSGDIVLSERINQSLAYLRSVCDLGG